MGQLLSSIGGLCGFVGWIWIVVIAFQDSKIIWAILSLCLPVVALVYGAMNFARLKVPTILLAIGLVFGGTGYMLF